jgi:hypothetical protein
VSPEVLSAKMFGSFIRASGKAPRGVLKSNRGFIELGSYVLNRLRRSPTFEFYPWNSPPSDQKAQIEPRSSGRDPLRIARYYQSLLDTGQFESRAALARFLGVSRARVTQVLKRLSHVASASSTTGAAPPSPRACLRSG